ncbi:Rieske (2Fe-2S) protein [Actinoplanes teichomyceticus]|uniref:Cytochrome bc1 complex Rieske iron-sulfur subunit n=1 Tax=Actinoplanes teichomyceticus TaxID=1867 RepID=A0A561WJB3_ACTTI|nr:Rieske (2Fe-2S) protein [Actinoplanes teichomyceticus]TWG23967.1 nitrite reductase/ring-hydroxylating ferredoxin subunit [Actinoplanes teichomyceticus]GIF12009.1 Rieske iron-sulfur protein [Actinoplanes teichomyceticus]
MTDVQTGTGADTQVEQTGPASTRRVVLLGAGGLGAAAVLAACGTDTSGTNPNGSDFAADPAPAGSKGADAQGGSTGGGDSAAGAALALVADVPAGGGIIQGDYVITQPKQGTYKAFTKICTHQGCEVGEVKNGTINCPCHGAKFSIETGSPVSGPAQKPLAETKVKVDGDNIVAA